jgi:two-component system sensor histidine kinase KdpD
MSEQRPDPDALLAAAMREGRGRLKIFLGAAPGVGKTWKMLAEAQRFRRAGIDVLAGVIETHGREETRAQADGLPVLPMRPVAYRGRWRTTTPPAAATPSAGRTCWRWSRLGSRSGPR